MRWIMGAVLVAVWVIPSQAFAVDKKKAAYLGGTLSGLSIPENAEGKLDTSGSDTLRFTPEKAESSLEIPYAGVEEIEYGFKRKNPKVTFDPRDSLLGSAILRRKHHYLTITYRDAQGVVQAVVFELGKSLVKDTLASLETKTGLRVVQQKEREKQQKQEEKEQRQ